MYKKLDDRREVFIGPIPRVITIFGFGAILLLLALIIVVAGLTKYKKTLQVPVLMTSSGMVAQVDAAAFSQLKQVGSLSVKVPVIDAIIIAKPDLKHFVLDKDKIIVPLTPLTDSLLKNLQIRGEVFCKADFVVENATLLQSVFKKR
jgi:hypothetical protein